MDLGQGGFDVYGWDDIFRAENCELTYHQMRERGIKNSSRDMVLQVKNTVMIIFLFTTGDI